MAGRYPAMEPYRDGMLDVGDGQFLHWEQCGKPAVVLHGGPGSGCSPWMRQLFDPDVYRVVLFDQRGAGRSLPHASEPSADLSVNTTAHLVADIEWLREHLGVERWLVHGMSWGSSLGLAYAEAHPQRVSEVVLAAVTMTRRCDVDWFARGVGRFFPAQWQAFRDGVPAADRDGDLVSVYARLLASPDPTVREQAARNWCDWEEAIVSVATGGTPNPRYVDPRFRMGFARLVTHYFSHAAWLEDDQLLREADRLAGIPSVLIHGRLDLGSPLRAAWRLAGERARDPRHLGAHIYRPAGARRSRHRTLRPNAERVAPAASRKPKPLRALGHHLGAFRLSPPRHCPTRCAV